MKSTLTLAVSILFLAPALVFADVSASIGGLNPGPTVGTNIPLSFSVLTSGFDYPTFRVVDSFPGGAATINIDSQGNFVWTPHQSDIGTHTITITVTDMLGQNASVSQTITVVTPGVSASAPTPASSVLYGTPVSFTLSSQGFPGAIYGVADGFFNSSATPNNLSPTYVFTWTPLYQDIGVHTFLISARDYQNYATSSVTIIVTGPPAATSSLSATASAAPTSTATSTAHTPQPPIIPTPTLTPIPGGYGYAMGGTILAPAPLAGAASTTPVFVSYLVVGSSGTEVRALQNKLTQLGFFNVAPTGYFGAITKTSVQAFQKSVGLEQVGWVGPGTRAALNK